MNRHERRKAAALTRKKAKAAAKVANRFQPKFTASNPAKPNRFGKSAQFKSSRELTEQLKSVRRENAMLRKRLATFQTAA